MENQPVGISAGGLRALRTREGNVSGFYNDVANNCTYGVGTLAHLGPCSTRELQQPTNPNQINTNFAQRVSAAEAKVRRTVKRRQLSQE